MCIAPTKYKQEGYTTGKGLDFEGGLESGVCCRVRVRVSVYGLGVRVS